MIKLVRATVEDAPKILEIKLRAFASEFETYGKAAIPPEFDSIEKQIRTITEQPYFFKIIKDGRISGATLAVDLSCGVFYLASIYIDADRQNQGIGTDALKIIEREFSQAKIWRLETPYLSYTNQRFYEKFGYKKVGEYVPPYSEGSDFILFKYEKIM